MFRTQNVKDPLSIVSMLRLDMAMFLLEKILKDALNL